MRKMFVLSIAILSLNAQAKMASTGQVKFSGDLNYSVFCKAIVEDDLDIFKRSVNRKVGVLAFSKREVLKKLIAAEGMRCNGVDLKTFAQQRKADSVAEYLLNLQ